jgi:hypothetical protein
MQRGLAMFFKFEHGSPILGLRLKKPSSRRLFTGGPECQTPMSRPPRA